MAVNFKRTHFYKAAGNCIPAVKHSIQFSYSAVTKISFNKAYDAQKGNIRRKLTALPLAVVSLARMVANLGDLLIQGLASPFTRNVRPLKNGAFQLIRNGEIFAGRIVGIFNDRLGQYHVQKADYNKSCYALSMQKTAADAVQEKTATLIQAHYDVNNPQKIVEEIERTFKSPNDQKMSLKAVLEDAGRKKDLEFLKNVRIDRKHYLDGEIKKNLIPIFLESRDLQKVREALKGSFLNDIYNLDWLQKTIQKQLDLENLEAVLILMKKPVLKMEVLENFNEKIAHLYCKKGMYDEACDFVKEEFWITDRCKEEIVNICAKHFKAVGELKKAKKAFHKMNWKTLEQVIEKARIAEQYLKVDRFEEAKAILRGIAHHIDIQQKLASKIAYYYCNHGMHKKAVRMTQKVLLLDDKTIENILTVCIDYYFEIHDMARAIQALSGTYGEFRENSLIRLAEKCLAANRIEDALRIVNHLSYFAEKTQVYCQNVCIKQAEMGNYEAAIRFCRIRLEGIRLEQTIRQITTLLLKDPKIDQYLHLINELCSFDHHRNPHDPLLIHVAANLIQAGDDRTGKKALFFFIRHLLLQKHRFLNIDPSPTEEKRLQHITEKLTERNFERCKRWLFTDNPFQVKVFLLDAVDQCDEEVKDSFDFPDDAFFDEFGRKLPKEVAKIKILNAPPKAPHLKKLYELCLKAEPSNYHQIFGLNREFTEDELNRVSKKLIILTHPDKNQNEIEAANEISKILTCMRVELHRIALPNHNNNHRALSILNTSKLI